MSLCGQVGARTVLALAFEATGLVLDFRLPRQGIVGHGELGVAQPLDLVAQSRRGLELEVGRGRVHAPLQVLDDGR